VAVLNPRLAAAEAVRTAEGASGEEDAPVEEEREIAPAHEEPEAEAEAAAEPEPEAGAEAAAEPEPEPEPEAELASAAATPVKAPLALSPAAPALPASPGADARAGLASFSPRIAARDADDSDEESLT
jgi:hypothetical protein